MKPKKQHSGPLYTSIEKLKNTMIILGLHIDYRHRAFYYQGCILRSLDSTGNTRVLMVIVIFGLLEKRDHFYIYIAIDTGENKYIWHIHTFINYGLLCFCFVLFLF